MPVAFIIFLALTATPPRVAVLDIQPRVGVSVELTQGITDDVVAEVRTLLPNAKVISADELRATLKYDLQRRDLGCDVASCLAEIGGALGVSQLVAGTLSRFGSTYLLSLKVIDPRTASVTHQSTQQIAGGSEEALLRAVGPAVRGLFPEAALPLLSATERTSSSAETALRAKTSVSWMPVAGWAGVGVSVASFTAGGILLGLAASERVAATSDLTALGTYHKTQIANSESAAGVSALITGGVILIPAFILLMLPHPGTATAGE